MRLAFALIDAQIAVSVINPAQAHDFAKALLKRSKTDAIDAQTLAELAARLQPQPWTPPPPVSTELQQRLVHRDALVDARTQFRNQLHALERQPIIIESVQTRLQELIATLNDQIAEVEQEISAALEQDEAWAAATAHLATIKGLGIQTIAWMLTATCNFQLTVTPEAAANYAGLVPQQGLSGKESALLRSPPHRTVHTTSTLHGSSKPHCSPCIGSFPRMCSLARAMELLMAVEMYQDHVAFGVGSPHSPRFPMVDMQFFLVEE
jgi:transposase